jgi:Flp pilus assembly protein TadG
MNLFSQLGPIKRRQRSQSLVEFSLSLVALIMLISGVIDLGRVYFVITAMEDIVGEGSVFLSQAPKCVSAEITGCANPKNAIFRMSSAGGGTSLINTERVVDAPTTVAEDSWYQICWPTDPDNFGISNPASYVQCSLHAGAGNDTTPAYDYGVGDTIYVEMNYNFKLWSPFIPTITGVNPIKLHVSATNIVVVK